jgi:hypothetical protein
VKGANRKREIIMRTINRKQVSAHTVYHFKRRYSVALFGSPKAKRRMKMS